MDMPEYVLAVSRGLAISMGCFVINSTGVLTQDTIDAYEPGQQERVFLETFKGRGCASIISPRSGKVLAGPMGVGEGIVYADVDLNDVIMSKMITDYAGHYNRFDIFSLHVNTSAPAPIVQTHAEAGYRETEDHGAAHLKTILSLSEREFVRKPKV
jgi:aliphatic nitrilase